MSYTGTSYPGSNDIQKANDRLQWVVEGGWTTGTNNKLGLSTGTTGLFQEDLAESTSGNYLTKIYDAFIKQDLINFAGLYAKYKYGNPNASKQNEIILFKYKSDIITSFFENQHEKIKNTIMPKRYTGRNGYFYQGGANVKGKLTSIWSFDVNLANKSVLNQLHSYDAAKYFVAANEAHMQYILNAFGFDDYLEDLEIPDAKSKGGTRALDDLTAGDQEQLDALKNAIRAARGLGQMKPLEPEQLRAVNQCALLTNLLHKKDSYSVYPTRWVKGGDKDNQAFNGRIYPVSIKDFNPDNLVNICTMPRNIQDFLDNSKFTSSTIIWDLYWVFQDQNGLHEKKIAPSTNKLDYPQVIKELKTLKLISDKDAVYLEDKVTKVGWNSYSLERVVINFDGTNPSTARNDVKVDLTINLGSLAALDVVCAYLPLETDLQTRQNLNGKINEVVELKIFDLVSAPVTNTFESTIVGPTGGLPTKREYKPDYSRIRLKAYTKDRTLKDCDLILDLATIGHKIDRDKEGKAVLTINYRGYFEQSLSAPYNDALSDNDLATNRSARAQRLIDAKKEKCSDKILREITRTNQEQERIDVEAFHKKGGLVKRIYEDGILYMYTLNPQKINLGLAGNILDPRLDYVDSISQQNQAQVRASNAQAIQQAGQQTRQSAAILLAAEAGEVSNNPVQPQLKPVTTFKSIDDAIADTGNFFFWLGDLMEILLDCLYENDTVKMHPHTKNLNLRFIVGTIRVPNPINLSETIAINPLQIPVDISFFASWYHDTIIKKGITNYPVGIFIKELIERLINDIIYDTCFSLLLPDENPPLLRTTYFTDHDTNWFKTYTDGDEVWFDPENPYAVFNTTGKGPPPNILMKKDATAKIENAKNYCVIYQQFPSYFRQLKSSNSSTKLKSDPYCPTIYHGRNMTTLNYIDYPAFSQQNGGSYLKEARFFNSQGGNFNLLSNVYDLSFNLISPKALTTFYPGNIINFILTDFVGGGDKQISSLPYSYSGTQADPHTKGTKANVLGMGGYHIVSAVSYELSKETSGANHTIKITTKFIGTDAKGDEDREDSQIPFANEPKKCIDIYNDGVESLRDTSAATGIDSADIKRIYSQNNITSKTRYDETTTPGETRLIETPVTPASSNGGSGAGYSSLIKSSSDAPSSNPEPSKTSLATAAKDDEFDGSSFFGSATYDGWSVLITERTTSGAETTIKYKVTKPDKQTYTDSKKIPN